MIPTEASAKGRSWDSLGQPTQWERAWVSAAMMCKNSRAKYEDPFLLLKLLRMETHPDLEVPEKWRGMSLAAACNESGFKPTARGDRGESVGLYQIRRSRHKNYVGNWGRCNYFDRTHPIGNLRCWLMRIKDTHSGTKRPGVPLASGKCGKRWGWTTAWVWVAVGPSPKGKMWQCFPNPPRHHFKKFKKMRKRAERFLRSYNG